MPDYLSEAQRRYNQIRQPDKSFDPIKRLEYYLDDEQLRHGLKRSPRVTPSTSNSGSNSIAIASSAGLISTCSSLCSSIISSRSYRRRLPLAVPARPSGATPREYPSSTRKPAVSQLAAGHQLKPNSNSNSILVTGRQLQVAESRKSLALGHAASSSAQEKKLHIQQQQQQANLVGSPRVRPIARLKRRNIGRFNQRLLFDQDPEGAYALSELFSQSEIPGFREIFSSDSYLRKFCWIVAFLYMTYWSLDDANVLINEYFSYPVTVDVRLRDSARLPFPAVTVCNLNVVRFSSLCTSNSRINLTNQIPSELRDRLCGLQVDKNQNNQNNNVGGETSNSPDDIGDINNIGLSTTTSSPQPPPPPPPPPTSGRPPQLSSVSPLEPPASSSTTTGPVATTGSSSPDSSSTPLTSTAATATAAAAPPSGDLDLHEGAEVGGRHSSHRHSADRAARVVTHWTTNEKLIDYRGAETPRARDRPNGVARFHAAAVSVGAVPSGGGQLRPTLEQNSATNGGGISDPFGSIIPPALAVPPPSALPEDFELTERQERELQENLTNWLAVMHQRDPQWTRQLGHQFDDMIMRCTMRSLNCTRQRSFELSFTPTEGNCFTYRSRAGRRTVISGGRRPAPGSSGSPTIARGRGKSDNNMNTNDDEKYEEANLAGPNEGLELVLNLEKNEYISGSSQVGALVMVHHPGDLGYAASEATFIAPEFTTYIGVKMLNITRLPEPYPEKCVYSWPAKFAERLARNSTYSQQACLKICLQRLIAAQCQCQSAFLPIIDLGGGPDTPPSESGGVSAGGNSSSGGGGSGGQQLARICDTRKLATRMCVRDVNLRTGDRARDCDCQPKCQVVRYDKTISVARWPTREDKVSFDRGKLDVNFQNLAKVIVYFQTMTCEEVSQQAVFNGAKLFSSLGGIMGMYVGFSFLSLFEIFEVISRKLWHHWRR